MKRVPMRPNDFVEISLLKAFEGGAVYAADQGGRFYVIKDESALAELLDEDEGDAVTVLEFSTRDERAAYLEKRGWNLQDPAPKREDPSQ